MATKTAPKTSSTSFSEFIRNASAAEKKRVYADVLDKATKRQNALLAERQIASQQH